jgi:hypothetical protein
MKSPEFRFARWALDVQTLPALVSVAAAVPLRSQRSGPKRLFLGRANNITNGTVALPKDRPETPRAYFQGLFHLRKQKGPAPCRSFLSQSGRNDYGFFVGLGNPPGLVVVAGVLVPEGWAEDLLPGLAAVAGRFALSLAITTSLKSILSLA